MALEQSTALHRKQIAVLSAALSQPDFRCAYSSLSSPSRLVPHDLGEDGVMAAFDNRVIEVAGEWRVTEHGSTAEFLDGAGDVVVAVDRAVHRTLQDLEGTTLLSEPESAPRVWWHDGRVFLAPSDLDAVDVADAVDGAALRHPLRATRYLRMLIPFGWHPVKQACETCGADDVKRRNLRLREMPRIPPFGGPWIGPDHKYRCGECGHEWAE